MPKGIRKPRRPTAAMPREPAPSVAFDEEAEKRRIQEFFRQGAQTRRMTLRITENDLYSLQIRARQEGIPYQTLMTSILHKYLTGQLVPTPEPEPQGKSWRVGIMYSKVVWIMPSVGGAIG